MVRENQDKKKGQVHFHTDGSVLLAAELITRFLFAPGCLLCSACWNSLPVSVKVLCRLISLVGWFLEKSGHIGKRKQKYLIGIT